jgi:hypothetical protein
MSTNPQSSQAVTKPATRSQKGAAVITPYYKESIEILERCHFSCIEQEGNWMLRHVMVADGHPRKEVEGWDVDHITLPYGHGDNGNTPRCIGAISAINQGYWPILFLDADNWFKPWHLNTVAALKESNPNADVLAMGRECVLPDGTLIPGVPEEDLNHQHIDTSCYVFYPTAFRVLSLWGMMPTYLGPVCDRVIREALKHHNLVVAGTHIPSVVFTTHYSWGYQSLNRPIPNDVHDINWASLGNLVDSDDIYNRTGLHFEWKHPSNSRQAGQGNPYGSSLSGPRIPNSQSFS